MNCKIDNEFDTIKINDYLKEELVVSNFKITYIDKMIHEKFSQKDKINKKYEHYFFKVDILEEFNLKDNFKWFSMDELYCDKRIMETNLDVIEKIEKLGL